MPVTIEGLPKAILKLDKSLYETPIKEFISEMGDLVQANVKARTPVVSSALANSITVTKYATMAKVSSKSVYASFIETGSRSDPRVRAGRVNRKAGAARMFRLGMSDSRAGIGNLVAVLKQRIAQNWGS